MWLPQWFLKRFGRLARLFGWANLDRRDALPAATRSRSSDKAKATTRLELQLLELRETPDDLFSMLGNGILFGGLPLMGQLDTPLSSFLRQDFPQPKAPVSFDSLPLGAQIELPTLDTRRDSSDLFNPLARPEYASTPEQTNRTDSTSNAGLVDADWLARLGDVFDSFAKKETRGFQPPAELAPSTNSGGGGDSSSFGPGSQQIASSSASAFPALGLGAAQDIVSASAMARGLSLDDPTTTGNTVAPRGDGDDGSTSGSSSGTLGTLGALGESGSQNPLSSSSTKPARASDFGRTRLGFEMNVGQTDSRVQFLSRGPGFQFFLAGNELVFATPRPAASVPGRPDQAQPQGRDVFRMRMVGMNPNAEVVGRDPLHQRSNYFIGTDSSKWHSNVPNYGSVEVREAFAGVDLILRSRTEQDRVFEYDFKVKPGASADSIRLRFEGVQGMHTDVSGRLHLNLGGRNIIQDAPILYQERHGVRTPVSGRYRLREGNEVGFEVTGAYDRGRDLILDHSVQFSSYPVAPRVFPRISEER